MDPKAHWEGVYRTKQPTEVSWYSPHLAISLDLITAAAPDRGAAVIDVGGGESTLVDDLLAGGYRDVTVLDLSATALAVAQARLGRDATRVKWICADVTACAFEANRYDVWHDRAVFHFLTDTAARRAYVEQVARAVKPGGHVIVATFGPQGPTQCSGLDVMRYAPDELHRQFGSSFALEKHVMHEHQTPSGKVQQFVYCYCKLLKS
jgi:2-polyprenyl-3-methyl-5-hydroxy-6-metoxy-1,4-benzoquinol methylase